MANFWVVNIDTQALIACFDDEGKANCTIGADQIWLEVPEGIAPGNCKVQLDGYDLTLVDGSADKAGPKWAILRAARDTKLTACDWTQMADSPLDSGAKASWATYRQALRDVPQNTSNPEDVSWPEQP